MFGSSVDDCLERQYKEDDLNKNLSEIDDYIQSDRDAVNDIIIHDSGNIDDLQIIRSQAIYNSDMVSERLITGIIWPFDTTQFLVGRKVIRRTHLDNNRNTRRLDFYDHLDTTIYSIISFDNVGNFCIRSDDNENIIISGVSTRYLAPID
ncbi:hypothetical protein DMUE_1777 [Dictyocoela muelleri]|nr:hypothetical protein DMUE_1777 [Dictyocoela muelleri]